MPRSVEELARARRLIAADGHLLRARVTDAAGELGSADHNPSPAERILRTAVAASEAQAAGRTSEAASRFQQVAEFELPLPGALLSAGRFFAEQNHRQLADECLGRAQLCGYGLESALVQREEPRGRGVERLKCAIDQEAATYVAPLCLLKHALLSKLTWLDAITGYGALFSEPGLSRLDRLPLLSLRDYARRSANNYMEVVQESDIPFRMPTIVGQDAPKTVPGHGRTLFYAALNDVVVTARSTLLEANGAMLYDYQGNELRAAPAEMNFDAVVFDADDDMVTIARLGSPPSDIPEAISLVGSSSNAFGHWTSEYLLKFFVLERAEVTRGVPILIDGGMPLQHRQALEFFTRGKNPIIELAPFSSVRVAKLWVCATFVFTPLIPRRGVSIGPDALCPHAAWLAELLGGVRKPEPRNIPTHERLFLSRRPSLKRKVVNLSEVEEICKKRGFVTTYLEDHSFEEQLWLVRNAKHIVGLSGAALSLVLLYGADETRLLGLHPPFLDATPLWTAIAEARGMEVLVLLGELFREDRSFRIRSDYRVDPTALENVLSSWKL